MKTLKCKKVKVYGTKWMATKLRSMQKLKGKKVKVYGTKLMATKLRSLQKSKGKKLRSMEQNGCQQS